MRGTFDDCQRLVKEAFLDPELGARASLSSANSINLGRLLPQAVYYAATSLAIQRRYGEPASFIVPSGNLGNALACLWARRMGLPIAEVVLAHNANRTVPDYLDSGDWRPRASVATLASAMDVGDPSNMERLRALYPGLAELRTAVSALQHQRRGDPRAHPRRLPRFRPDVVSAHRHRRRGLVPPEPGATPRRAAGCWCPRHTRRSSARSSSRSSGVPWRCPTRW